MARGGGVGCITVLVVKARDLNCSFAVPPRPMCTSIDDFCHDIRNPLTTIKTFASIIANGLGGPVSAEQREYLGTIMKSATEAARMIDEFSKQDADQKE